MNPEAGKAGEQVTFEADGSAHVKSCAYSEDPQRAELEKTIEKIKTTYVSGSGRVVISYDMESVKREFALLCKKITGSIPAAQRGPIPDIVFEMSATGDVLVLGEDITYVRMK